MKSTKATTLSSADGPLARLFAALFGVLLALSLLKFGNPAIMEKLVVRPTDVYEVIINPWPIRWGYWLLGGVVTASVAVTRWRRGMPVWLVALPMFWLGWQFLAALQTVDASLTKATLAHFTASVVCFYLGLLSLSRVKRLTWFWAGLVGGLLLVLLLGFQQHLGGLEESRRYFYLYIYPNLREIPPEYLKKISSNRIFSTLFYPNALAGILLLLLPATLVTIWRMGARMTVPARWFLVMLVGFAALACLYWSGSKGGWLLMLLIGLVVLLRLRFRRELKLVLVSVVLIVGLAGFFWKYSGFFARGATSVGARFDYWRAALQTVKGKPLFGSGPGTFSIAYAKIKKPEAEMARLTHNDYLQQASDSGVIGFLAYAAFIVGSLAFIYRRCGIRGDWLRFSIWLGLLGWSLQGLLEFGLYIPALAWPAFTLMGWLLGTGIQIDKQQSVG